MSVYVCGIGLYLRALVLAVENYDRRNVVDI